MTCLILLALIVAVPLLMVMLFAVTLQAGALAPFLFIIEVWVIFATVRYLYRYVRPAKAPETLITPKPVVEALPPLQPMQAGGHWLEINERTMKGTCLVCNEAFPTSDAARVKPCAGARTSLT